MEIPAYLTPNAGAAPMSIDQALTINPDWNLPATTAVKPQQSFWQDIADAPQQGAEMVYSSVTGTWSAVKDITKTAVADLKNGVSGLGNEVGSFVGILEGHFFLILGGIVVAIWFLAKSGILTQVAAVMH